MSIGLSAACQMLAKQEAATIMASVKAFAG
jgi:hypothetical protein